MNRLYSTCPECEAEVLVSITESGSVPGAFQGTATCLMCGKSFTVTARNAVVAPANNPVVVARPWVN
jgi:transcription elongation factor Elf1